MHIFIFFNFSMLYFLCLNLNPIIFLLNFHFINYEKLLTFLKISLIIQCIQKQMLLQL